MEQAKIKYGCDELGKLTHVMLHRSGKELELIDQHNFKEYLFDEVPDVTGFIDEHKRYRELLLHHGVEVIELTDYVTRNLELVAHLPNLVYLHDVAVISKRGAILSSMAKQARRKEEVVVREALENLGIPIFIEFNSPHDAFEGCLLLSPETLLVANTERHSRSAIKWFTTKALQSFKEVIYVDVPKTRQFMHPDTIYGRISENLALIYLPAFKSAYLLNDERIEEIDFPKFMQCREVDLINVSESEQQRLACSFVPLQPNVIIHHDTALDRDTQRILARKGVDIIFFHLNKLLAGGGSLRCMTLRLHRQPVPEKG